MGKHSVLLRPRPRLIVESFEDRRLLSSGPSLFSLSHEWLNSSLLKRSLDTRSLSVLSSPAESDSPAAAAQVESGKSEAEARIIEEKSGTDSTLREEERERNIAERNDPVLEKDVHTQVEVTRENLEDLGENVELPTQGNGENADDSSTGGEPQTKDGPRGEPEYTENDGAGGGTTGDTNAEENSGADSTNHGADDRRAIRETLRDRLKAHVSEEATSYPVVIQALKNTLHERADDQDDRGNLNNNLVQSSDEATPATVADGPNSAAYEARPSQEVNHAPATLPIAETRSEIAGPHRTALARNEVTLPSHDHVGGVDGQASGSLGLRAEMPALPGRDVDRPSPAQGLPRGPSETAGTGRGPETGDTRHAAQVMSVTAEPTASATPQRVGMVPRQTPQQTSHGTPRAAEGETAEDPTDQTAENTEPVRARLGIMDLAAFIPHFSGLMQGSVPFDQDAMQAAMQQFLEQMESLGGDAASWLTQMNLSPWVVAIAVGLTGCEVARRRQQQAQRGLVVTDDDGTPLTWFPGLAGLWTMREA